MTYSLFFWGAQKSDNDDEMGRRVDGMIISLTKRLMFKALFFFIISCKMLFKNPSILFLIFFHTFTKIEIRTFEWKPATN